MGVCERGSRRSGETKVRIGPTGGIWIWEVTKPRGGSGRLGAAQRGSEKTMGTQTYQ